MQSFRAGLPNSRSTKKSPSALTGFVEEVYGTLARVTAYVATLALLVIGGSCLWQHLPDAAAMVLAVDFDELSETDGFRHPQAGRVDGRLLDSSGKTVDKTWRDGISGFANPAADKVSDTEPLRLRGAF